nr:PREDICTED: protein CASC5 [Paralichthys olivaceus]
MEPQELAKKNEGSGFSKRRISSVGFDTVEGFGEKTVVFSTDDAFMDMTHSQTMILASYADTSLQIGDAFPTGEKKVMFPADDASMDTALNHTVNMTNASLLPGRKKDLSVKRNISSSSLDQGFENFLASLSKPGGPSSLATVETNNSVAHIKTQKANVDKENLLPTPVSAMMEKSLNKPRKSEVSSYGLCPDVDVSMNLTEVQTGRILAVTDDDNPFQCLFPTQDMYAHSNKRESQTAEVMLIKSEDRSQQMPEMASMKNPSLNASYPRCKVNFNARDEYTDKTIRFTEDEEFMDMTQSHTVGIARGPLAPQQVSPQGLDSGFKSFLTGLSKPTVPSVNPVIERVVPLAAASSQKTVNMNRSLCELKTPLPDAGKENWSLNTSRSCRESSNGGEICPDTDVTMEMTETQTGHIFGNDGSDDPFQFLFPTRDMYPHSENLKKAEMTSGQKNSKVLGSLKHAGLHTQDKSDPEDDHRERTVRFSADDACMDVTRSHTVNIGTDFSHKHLGSLSSRRDKTIRFSVNDAGMDMTQCLTDKSDPEDDHRERTVKIDAEDDCKEESARSSPDDAATNVADCLAVYVDSTSASDSLLPHQETNITSAQGEMDSHLTGKKRGRSLSTRSLDHGFKNSLSRMSCPWVTPVKIVTPAGQRPLEGANTNDHLQIQKPGVDNSNAAMENSQNRTMADFTEMEMTEAQTGCIFEQSCTDELPQCFSSSQDSEQTEAKSQQSNEAASVEITNSPESVDSYEIAASKEPEPRNETASSQKMESSLSAVDQDLDALGSRKSRRISLADIQSKVKRLSHMINSAPDAFVLESCTATLPHFDDDLDKTSKDKTKPLPAAEPELEMSFESNDEKTQDQYLTRGGEAPAAATPFNLKTKQLMSRLSMGSFKPKLPQISKPSDPKVLNCAGELTRTITVNVTKQLSNVDNDVSDIFDEELDSYEDASETLNPRSPKKITERASDLQEADIELLEEDVFEEDCISAVHGKKRAMPNDENDTEDEKRLKASTEEASDINDVESQSDLVEYDGNLTAAPNMTTHATDCSSSSHTASIRCEATFESTFKHSMYESQLEDYTSDAQKKLADGTITVLEFFKLFNIDFVIHNPRQSVLPGRVETNPDHQSERKISHINFKLQLNDEKSRCHARLVHKLLSQYVDSETSWVEKYPTSRHVPTLLHDVGLVVSRCRLLGEELRLLKMWGGLQLDILDISCVDTQVHIVFSSLQKLSKFEVVFSVGLIDHLCVVQVQSFNNVIGSTVIQQIEEVVASFSPTKNLFTKIVKKIHDHLLC